MEELDRVILVDKCGYEFFYPNGTIRTAGKIQAHKDGLLHRAVSVFIFNNKQELLLQKRASGKYHSATQWTNTCCTHPHPGETPLASAHRRLKEEMGIEAALTEAFTFLYKANVGNGLVENEFDHVFIGFSNHKPEPDANEVSDWKWISKNTLRKELKENPGTYTPWIRICFDELMKHLAKSQPSLGIKENQQKRPPHN